MLQAPLPLQVVDEEGRARDSFMRVVILKYRGKSQYSFYNIQRFLTASYLKEACVSIEWVVIKIHAARYCDPNPVSQIGY